MTKDQYQNLDCVKKFSSWMSSHLDDDTFSHQYTNIKNGKEWSCSSLYSAYTQYQWGNSNFVDNNNTLLNLRKNLENAITNQDPESLYQTAIEVMKWGGVMQGNAVWLYNNKETLLRVIKEMRDALNAGNQDSPVLNNADLRFNAGMTKVYSLICNNFIIYDSRVAAALGWVVTKFCQSQNLQEVPAELRFPWSAARGAQQRNPCINGFIFPRLQSGSIHARWNLKASWLLEAVIHHNNAKSSEFIKLLPEDKILRALESALFMIGYNLNSQPENEEEIIELSTFDLKNFTNQGWIECYTPTKKNIFWYKIFENKIEALSKNGKSKVNFLHTDIDKIISKLRFCFANKKPFSLKNSATKVRANEENPGLGCIYYKVTNGGNPPDTSKLAAILQDLGVFKPVLAQGKRHWIVAEDFSSIGSFLNSMELDD